LHVKVLTKKSNIFLLRITKIQISFKLLIFEQQNKREFYLELGVLTKNVIVMLLIVVAEAALR
jgi:hypothetical protein